MATDHTDGAPPKRGSTNLVNIGCTRNNSEALSTMAAMNVANSKERAAIARRIGSLMGRSAIPMSLALSRRVGGRNSRRLVCRRSQHHDLGEADRGDVPSAVTLQGHCGQTDEEGDVMTEL